MMVAVDGRTRLDNLVKVIVAYSLVRYSDAVKCYKCQWNAGDLQNDCAGVHASSYQYANMPTPIDDCGPHGSCMKIQITRNDEIISEERDCTKVEDPRLRPVPDCYTVKLVEGESENCYCSSDYCNSAPYQKQLSVAVCLGIVCQLLMRLNVFY